jgi:hypothetical protein
MVAGVFAKQGYHVAEEEGDELRPGDAHNPGGYWEAETLVERNVEVFRAAGFPHHNTWLFDAAPPELVARIAALSPLPGHVEFVREYESRAPWLWKDPRLCYTLAYWWKLLDPATTRVVLTDRDPASIYRSFVRLRWRDPSREAENDVLRRIEQHLAAARSAVDSLDIPYFCEPYQRFASEPEAIADALSAFAGVQVGVDDLGFESRYNHSTLRGRLTTALMLRYERLPAWARRAIKAIVSGARRASERA